jgi:hypothetical protein
LDLEPSPLRERVRDRCGFICSQRFIRNLFRIQIARMNSCFAWREV